ncbi:MAG: 4Fe-4S dicluster domain-containing protein [Gammaproteobacteria bacterium]
MLFRTRADARPYHLGRFPLESIARDPARVEQECARAAVAAPPPRQPARGPLAAAARDYLALQVANGTTTQAEVKAPVPDDPGRRAIDAKGYAYFMDASQVGICALPEHAWYADRPPERDHTHAIVVLVEHPRVPEAGNPARDWVEHAVADIADQRAGSIAICLAGHIRQLGWSARAHVADAGDVDAERLAVMAGLALRGDADAALVNPYVDAFSLAVVTTDYRLATDQPLGAAAARARGLRYWLGINGATSGRERRRQRRRATHLGRYPMETVRRVDRPTTLILDDEIPRVPKRAAFFERALRGDLGEKAQRERHRFAYKQPHTAGMLPLMRAMVARQGGPVTVPPERARFASPAANSRAVKSLAHALGADIVGICQVPHYAWYSHDSAGNPLEPRHRFAIVMLIDQEFDTMEGASGDDWISGTQSMRAYLRGAEMAGMLAETLRQSGFPARAQTNIDSDVLHIPLMLLAGLGELSRIGELVLNPFVGPRLKTVVVTTDLPLEVDRPIDFGLQYFCTRCTKCARECPCDAISWGEKVMFNGYETWKPDVERCTRYRLTNARGSACGRCMKTCPLNKVVTADGPLLERLASWCGIRLPLLKPLLVPLATRLDDRLGHGELNPAKKWWFDLEVVDGACVAPPKGVNQRGLSVGKRLDPGQQKIAYYPANSMPPPDEPGICAVDRKAALAAAADIEKPCDAARRRAAGRPAPPQWQPTPARRKDQTG